VNVLFKDGQRVPVTFLLVIGVSCTLAMTGCKSEPKPAEKSDFSSTVRATQPLAYYRLESTKGSSEAGTTTYEFTGGASNSSPGAAISMVDNHFALLNGKDAWIKTTQMGGIDRAGSIMAWVNLAALPKAEGRILYVAGESHSGNDFDLQFEPDNNLRFFTTAGGHLDYAPDPNTLVNQWHLIVATMDAVAPSKALYWDGQPVAKDQAPNTSQKTTPFTIGESPVFTGRFFHGGIDEVAIWDRALSPADVAAIYKTATTKP
jgi:hypothetical protein